jgi:hypothetical protein
MEDPRYVRGKVYKIFNVNDNKVYIGSTTESLGVRWSKHKHDCKNYPKRSSLYKHVTNWADWKMELFEQHPCKNRKELEIREYEVMGTFDNIVNKKKKTRATA